MVVTKAACSQSNHPSMVIQYKPMPICHDTWYRWMLTMAIMKGKRGSPTFRESQGLITFLRALFKILGSSDRKTRLNLTNHFAVFYIYFTSLSTSKDLREFLRSFCRELFHALFSDLRQPPSYVVLVEQAIQLQCRWL